MYDAALVQIPVSANIFKFALKCKYLYRIGPKSEVRGGREAKSGKIFSRLEGGGGQKEKFLLPFHDA